MRKEPIQGGRGLGPVDTTLTISTPEQVEFQVRLAGPAPRAFAWLIDLAVSAAVLGVLSLIFVQVFPDADISQGLILLTLFALQWGYGVFFELLFAGQTPGKKALGLRVLEEGHLPVGPRASLLRNLLRAADFFWIPPGTPVLLGPIAMALDPKFRRIGDWVAGTFVVAEGGIRLPDDQLMPVDEALVASLPPHLGLDRQEREAIELYVSRGGLGEARRQELAAMVAPELARRFGVPRPQNPQAFLHAVHRRMKSGAIR